MTMARWLQRTEILIAAISALFVVQAAIRFSVHLTHDAAWYLYAGRRLLGGAVLYRDIVEVNPPLGIWLSAPIAALADGLGIVSTGLFKAIVLLLTVVVLAMAGAIMRHVPDLSRVTSNAIVIALAALLLFLPAYDFGQREHLLILLVTPWLMLRWCRVSGGTVLIPLAVLVGALAAVGFALKPHCVLGAVAVEVALFAIGRRPRLLFAPENITGAVLGVVYLAGVWLLTPDFFTRMIEMGRVAYIPFYGYGFGVLAFRAALPVALGLVAAVLMKRLPPPLRALSAILVAAGAGFVAAYVLQAGFRYQLLPALFVLAFAASLVPLAAASGAAQLPRLAVLASALLVAVALVTALANQWRVYPTARFEAGIAQFAPGARSVLIASTNVYNGFPLVEEQGLIWASRFPASWLAPYVAATLAPDGGPANDLSRYAVRATVDDLAAYRPDIVFVNEAPEQSYYRGAPLDFVRFWSHDPRFATLWQDYERRGDAEGYAIYVRRTP
jgi:hypothetical protein